MRARWTQFLYGQWLLWVEAGATTNPPFRTHPSVWTHVPLSFFLLPSSFSFYFLRKRHPFFFSMATPIQGLALHAVVDILTFHTPLTWSSSVHLLSQKYLKSARLEQLLQLVILVLISSTKVWFLFPALVDLKCLCLFLAGSSELLSWSLRCQPLIRGAATFARQVDSLCSLLQPPGL